MPNVAMRSPVARAAPTSLDLPVPTTAGAQPTATAGSIQTPNNDSQSLHSTSAISTRPPSYGRHLHDELLSPPASMALRSSNRLSRPRSIASVASTTCHITQMLQTLTSTEPLSLTIDNNSLYPPPPSSALYHLPRVLTWSGTEISLARSLPWPRRGMRCAPRQARDLALYTMRRTPFTHEVQLVPRREGLKGAVMRGHRGLLGGMTWEVEVRGGKKLLTYSKGRWKVLLNNGKNYIIAKEMTQPQLHQQGSSEQYDIDGGKTISLGLNGITIEGQGVELWMKDLVVAAWCSRIWQSHKINSRRTLIFGRTLMSI
jgi:hypothetical protein